MPCNDYNVGLWVRQNSDIFLRSLRDDGLEQINYDKATPQTISVLLDKLEDLTNLASERIAAASDPDWSSQKEQLTMRLGYWREELAVYRRHVSDALASGLGPESIWFCVTAPLLLGWYGNSDCTDVDPNQETQMPARIAIPLELLNGALCLDESQARANQSVADYFYALAEGLGEIGGYLGDAAAETARAAADAARAAKKIASSNLALLGIAGIAAIAGYFLFIRK